MTTWQQWYSVKELDVTTAEILGLQISMQCLSYDDQLVWHILFCVSQKP